MNQKADESQSYARTIVNVNSQRFIVCLLTGDIGGYLGLLIGGSVLTVIEVIDLVFYNSLMRCCGRR